MLEQIIDTGIDKPLNEFISRGRVYVGISAGSIVGAGNLPNNSSYLRASLRVQTLMGTASGAFENEAVTQIDLTDNQAVFINGAGFEIIGECE